MSSKALDNILDEISFRWALLYQLLNGFSFGAEDNLLKAQFVVLYGM